MLCENTPYTFMCMYSYFCFFQEFDFRYTDVFLYSLEPDKLKLLIQQPDVLPWRQNFSIPGRHESSQACRSVLLHNVYVIVLTWGQEVFISVVWWSCFSVFGGAAWRRASRGRTPSRHGDVFKRHVRSVRPTWHRGHQKHENVCNRFICLIVL